MVAYRLEPNSQTRRAMTLLEVLLVLALLAIIAAITWPALERPLASQRLRKAADAIQAEWVRARVDAMSSGQTCVFQFALDENRYWVEQTDGPEAVVTSDASVGSPIRSPAASAGSTGTQRSEEELPEGVTFAGGETAYDTRADFVPMGSDPSMAGTCAPAIFFYPDGTTSTAQLSLKNDRDEYIDLSLRGLTGTVTIGSVYTAEERMP